MYFRIGTCKYGLEAVLILEDGSTYRGCGFGAKKTIIGEVVFTTSMVGYPETLTDPSYAGQILVITHPLIGNYGVASRTLSFKDIPLHFESDRIWVNGLIIHELTEPSHWSSIKSLHDWLLENDVPGMYRVDTRALVKKLRERGVMMGILHVYDPSEEEPNADELYARLKSAPRYDDISFIDYVSPKEPITHGDGRRVVSILDCGVKYGIVRELLMRDFKVTRYPPNTKPERLIEDAVGVVISNGPGNPAILTNIINTVKILTEYNVPILGICLGHQLTALAHDGKTFKLRYGHRGSNKPVKDLFTGRCYVTTQNHGFAVDYDTVKREFKLWFVNIDDKTVEGLEHKYKPIITVQFHPEASPGPLDTSWIFDKFVKLIEKSRI